jgi:CHAD domain-containing protein
VTEVSEPIAATTKPTEIELKYRVTRPATGERLITAERIGPLVAGGARGRTTHMEDRYVDTADGALARAGYAVRLRQSGASTIVSIKSLASTDGHGGAVRREELEGPADRTAPARDWPTSDARALVIEHAGDAALVDRITVRQVRRKRVVKAGLTRVELSLDDVEVVDGGEVVGTFTEFEAELRKGDEAVFIELAATLDGEAGLTRSTESKLAVALAMAAATSGGNGAGRPEPASGDADPVPPSAERASAEPPAARDPGPDEEPVAAARLTAGKTPGVTADDHVAEAGRKVLRFHLARMIEYEPGTRSGERAEDLHKMRVATRRQRAAWRVFGESFRDRRTRRYRRGLREVAGRLGAVRDLDVLLEAADVYRADLPTTEQRALEPLLAAWRAHRDDARALLIRELDSDGHRRWLDDYVDFVRTEGASVLTVGPVQPHRIRDTAASRIWLAYEGVRGYEPVLRWADVETLHDLRIAGKWLRYTLEFVREALGPESGVLIARVTALQDHLGLMHDADVSASLARTFLVEHGADLSVRESTAIGRYLVDRERETARLRRTVGVPWRGVAGVSFKRTLGRVVAGL